MLHHTGSVWKAIENTSTLVAAKGQMYLALYSLDVQPNAEYWLKTKEKYLESSYFRKIVMEQSYLYTYYCEIGLVVGLWNLSWMMKLSVL